MAEEKRFNKIFDLIMIAGEPDSAAPFVGISAQLDEFQDFLGDEFSSMTGEEDMTKAPELWEAQDISQEDLDADMAEQLTDMVDQGQNPEENENARGLGKDPDIYNREELEKLIIRLKAQAQSGDAETHSREPLTIAAVLLAVEAVVTLGPPLVKGLSKAWKWGSKAWRRGKRAKAITRRLKTGVKALPKTLRNADTRQRMVQNGVDMFNATSTTAMMLTSQMGDMMAQVTSLLQIYMTLYQMSDYLRAFSPNLATLYDQYIMLNDTVGMMKLEEAGLEVETNYPRLEEEEAERQKQINAALTTGKLSPEPEPKPEPDPETRAARDTAPTGGTTGGEPANPTEPSKLKHPGKPCVAIPKIQSYTINDALRHICRELSILEKEFKVFNSRMAMDKDEIPKFLSGKESTIITKDIGVGEILFRALNTAGKETNAAGVAGPTEVLSLAEQFKQAFPVVEVIDSITKKKSTVSVFELIMKAQDAKVVELGPGFLKWYTELDVMQQYNDVIETPKSGQSIIT